MLQLSNPSRNLTLSKICLHLPLERLSLKKEKTKLKTRYLILAKKQHSREWAKHGLQRQPLALPRSVILCKLPRLSEHHFPQL